MFTIKVVKETGNRVNGQTFMYEAKRPWHQRRVFANKKEFISVFNALHGGQPLELCMDSPPDDDSYQDFPENKHAEGNIAGEFLQINTIDGDGHLRIIFTQCATVYIMHNGQTVDKIYC